MKSIDDMSFEELLKLHDSNIVAGLNIANFKAATKTRAEILLRYAELEKENENLKIKLTEFIINDCGSPTT